MHKKSGNDQECVNSFIPQYRLQAHFHKFHIFILKCLLTSVLHCSDYPHSSRLDPVNHFLNILHITVFKYFANFDPFRMSTYAKPMEHT
jgi:hypothetical protein